MVSGKNWFDGSSAGTAGQYLSSDGTIASGNTNLRYTGLIKMPDGANDITVSGITAGWPMDAPALCFYNKDQTFISGESYVNATAKTFSVPNNAVYFATSYRTIYPNFQVEAGTTVTIYEPYHIPVETTIYLDRPLYKCGDMADWIDYKEGKRHNVIGEIVLDGSEDWADFRYSSGDTNFGCQYDTAIQNILTPPANPANLLCNYFKAANRDTVYAKTEVGIAQYGGDLGKIFICAPISILDGTNTLVQWKTWLSAHNLEVIYPLSAETEEDIILPTFNLWNGTNIFTVNTSVLPSQVQWEYITNAYSTITQQIDVLQDEQTETNNTETIDETVQDTPQTEVE